MDDVAGGETVNDALDLGLCVGKGRDAVRLGLVESVLDVSERCEEWINLRISTVALEVRRTDWKNVCGERAGDEKREKSNDEGRGAEKHFLPRGERGAP